MSFDLEREEIIQRICRDFANDRLTTQELDARLEAAYRATSSAELHALVAPSTSDVPSYGATDQAVYGGREPAPMAPGTPLRVRAMFASIKKQGDWEPAPVTYASATFGEVLLDFREARIRPGVTIVHVSATCGSIEIIVPPGLHIECDGSATFGEFTERISLSAPPDVDAPTLRITGEALFGEVRVVMRLPGETASDARRREKAVRSFRLSSER
jgi:Cell wall-active antibiotics response 4TMS YvqF/Domain of unknown function (DUF1707)